MDLVQEEMREDVYEERSNYLKQHSQGLKISCIATSIWDETLYKAWSSIIYTLIPNIPVLEKHLQVFAENADAEEVVLFERTTFLVISHASRSKGTHPDPQRFEKISNIVKQFKLSCAKIQSQFTSFEMKGSNFSAFICQYTVDTYILVVMGDACTGEWSSTSPCASILLIVRPESATTLLNIKYSAEAAKAHFSQSELS